MPMPVIPVPQYPNVPNAPGVPPLSRASRVQPSIVLATQAAGIIGRLIRGPQWGIFSEAGAPLLLGSSVKAFDYKNDANVASFPIEQGAFANYNKVQTPWDARVSFTVGAGLLGAIGGGTANRAAFLATCERLLIATTLVVVLTPEVTYPSANIVHYDYRRTNREGVSLLTVDVWVQQIRQTAVRAFSQAGGTAQPSGAETVAGGTVQGAAPTAVQAAALPAPELGGLY